MGNKTSKKAVDIVPDTATADLMQLKFMDACQTGKLELVARLLDRGTIDVNLTTSPVGATAFFYACQNGHDKVVALLLDRARDAIDINQTVQGPAKGATPLIIGCSNGHSKVVALLLETARDTINVNQTTIEGATPILMAAHQGDKRIVTQLLAHPGIDVNLEYVASDGRKYTPLQIAEYHGYTQIANLIQKHTNACKEVVVEVGL